MFERVIRFRTHRSCLIHSIRVEDGRVVSREFDVKVVRERNRKKKKKDRGSAGLSKVSTKIYLYYTSMRDDACKIRLCIKRRGVFTSLRNSAS